MTPEGISAWKAICPVCLLENLSELLPSPFQLRDTFGIGKIGICFVFFYQQGKIFQLNIHIWNPSGQFF